MGFQLVTHHDNVGQDHLGLVVEVTDTHADGSPLIGDDGQPFSAARVVWLTGPVTDPIPLANLTVVDPPELENAAEDAAEDPAEPAD